MNSSLTHILERLHDLETEWGAFEGPQEEQRRLIEKATDYALDFIAKLPEAKSYQCGKVPTELFSIDGRTRTMEELLRIYHEEVVEKGIKPASGGHLGYIPGGGLYPSAVADYLAAVTNEYAGVNYASPGAVAIENALIEWFGKLFGFPDTAAGNLTSGGSIANLIAIVCARDKFGVRNERIPRHVVYLGPQTHHCIYKSLRIAGLEDVIMRTLKTDDEGRVDTTALHSQIKEDRSSGLIPFLVIASAGTTDTGVVDPLQEIGDLTQQENMWYHIDAAYGGFFILTETKKQLFKGIELADSLVIDPHKGLFIPYGLGAVLIRDKGDMLRSFSSSANYMQDAIQENEILSPADISPELTKHFRGLRLWLPLKLYGIKPFVACLEEKLLLTEYIRLKLEKMGFRVGPEPDLSVSYFWYPSEKTSEDAFNRKLLEFIHEDGSVFLSSTLIDGRFVIRTAILSFRTTVDTVERCLGMIERSLEETELYFKGGE